MNKPITLVREETIQKLTNVINESGLPAFIIEPILKDFLNETRGAMQRQYEIERVQYEQSLESEKSKETTDK